MILLCSENSTFKNPFNFNNLFTVLINSILIKPGYCILWLWVRGGRGPLAIGNKQMKTVSEVRGEKARLKEALNGILIPELDIDCYLLNDFADVDRDFLSVDFDNPVEVEGELYLELRIYAN